MHSSINKALEIPWKECFPLHSQLHAPETAVFYLIQALHCEQVSPLTLSESLMHSRSCPFHRASFLKVKFTEESFSQVPAMDVWVPFMPKLTLCIKYKMIAHQSNTALLMSTSSQVTLKSCLFHFMLCSLALAKVRSS